ncbi:MAG TPA: hypothetical protein PLK12_08260 [Prolixibacteraceae bacterium]|nr:hypothetical protein [Prolixibacteraceae bacterium]
MKTGSVFLAAFVALGFFSCQQADDLSPQDEALVLKSAEIAGNDLYMDELSEESLTEVEFFSQAEVQLKNLARIKGRKHTLLDWKVGMRYPVGQCPDVSIDTAETGYPVTITLDYGDSTELTNGRVLSGIVSIVISGPRFIDGSTRMITYTDFQIDSVGIAGTVREQFRGDNETSREVTVVGDLQFTLPDGTVVKRESEKVRTWLEGLDTPEVFEDDVIEITGFVQAESSSGTSWAKTILEPLVREGSCRYYVQGIVAYSENGEVLAQVDFGDGACDETATLTVNGEDIEIELTGQRPHVNTHNRKAHPGANH